MSRLASTVHRFGASTSPLSIATKLGTIKYCRNALPPGSLLLPATWSGGVKRVECCQCAASARAPLLRRDSSRIRGCQVVAVQGVETILEATVSTLLVRYFFCSPSSRADVKIDVRISVDGARIGLRIDVCDGAIIVRYAACPALAQGRFGTLHA